MLQKRSEGDRVSTTHRILLAVFLCLVFSNALCAQVDVNGRWLGTMVISSSGFVLEQADLDLTFAQNGTSLTGSGIFTLDNLPIEWEGMTGNVSGSAIAFRFPNSIVAKLRNYGVCPINSRTAHSVCAFSSMQVSSRQNRLRCA